MPFNFRENTSSGKPQEAMSVTKATGAKHVGKVLGTGEPGNVHGFRPGGACQTGYNTVGGKSGLQVKIPAYRDQSKVK
jgi:hypothetical protein